MKKRNLILVTLILLLSFSATALAEETTGETSPEAALSDDASASVVTLNQAPEAITSAAKSEWIIAWVMNVFPLLIIITSLIR